MPSPTRRALLSLLPAAAFVPRTVRAAQAPLTVAAFPLVDRIAADARPAWRALHPEVALNVIGRQYGDHHTAMATALTTAAQLPDVMALEASQLGRFAIGTGLQDLRVAPFGIEAQRDAFTPFAYAQAGSPRGEVVAAPADIGPGTMLLRHDVLERAGLAPEALTRSWDDYVEAGRQIRARTGAKLLVHVRALKDIVIRSGLKSGEGLYFDEHKRVLLQASRFRRAFELARTIRREGLDAKLQPWSNEWAESVRRGRLASELGGAWLVGQLSSWVAPQTAGLWRAAPFPEGANASYGGIFYAMPRRLPPERQRLAWDFIRLMCLDRGRQLAAFESYDAFPALRAAQQAPIFDAPVPFLGGQPARRQWVAAAERIAAPRLHRQDGFADEVVNTELDKVLLRDKPIDLALQDAETLIARRALR